MQCQDDFEAQGLNDTACISSLHYIIQLVTVFLQGSPVMRQLHEQHRLFVEHNVFSTSQYRVWEHIQLKHLESVSRMSGHESSIFCAGAYNVIERKEGDMQVMVCNRDVSQTCHLTHAEYLSNEATKVRESLTVRRSTMSDSSRDIPCCRAISCLHAVATSVWRTRADVVRMSKKLAV